MAARGQWETGLAVSGLLLMITQFSDEQHPTQPNPTLLDLTSPCTLCVCPLRSLLSSSLCLGSRRNGMEGRAYLPLMTLGDLFLTGEID